VGAVEGVMRGLSSSRGAIYVEYAVAIVPMFALFWGLLQLNGLLLADLVVRDAAQKAVRAAIVCDSDDGTSGESGGMTCAQQAVEDTVKAVHSITDAQVVSLEGASSSGNQEVTAVVSAHYSCQVPLVGALICAAIGGGELQRSAQMPNQGHYYKF